MQIPDVPVTTAFTLGGLAMASVIVYQNLTQTSLVKQLASSMVQQREAELNMQRFTLDSLTGGGNGTGRRTSLPASTQ